MVRPTLMWQRDQQETKSFQPIAAIKAPGSQSQRTEHDIESNASEPCGTQLHATHMQS
jgi:hypothetical protein